MSGVNKAIILGNVGADPESKTLPNGGTVVNFSVATSEKYTDKTGQKVEKTEWHRVVAFNKLAEIIAQYVRKGSKIYIEGKIQTRKWQDTNGKDCYTTEIIANEMQMLDSKPQNVSENVAKVKAAVGFTSEQLDADNFQDKDLPF